MAEDSYNLRSGAAKAEVAPRRGAASRRLRSSPPDINIIRQAGEWGRAVPGYKAQMKEWCRAALSGRKPGTVSIVLADDAFIRSLNHQYRGKDKPTNVLSFPGDGEELGDIVLSLDTIKREAKEQKKPMRAHTAHMIVHGALHLLGFDHEKDKDASAMETKETAILARIGFANPYEVR